MFGDLKLISADEVIRMRPDLFASEGQHRHSETDVHHRTFCAQIEHEQERRKKVMQEIDVLMKKKKSLQDEVLYFFFLFFSCFLSLFLFAFVVHFCF